MKPSLKTCFKRGQKKAATEFYKHGMKAHAIAAAAMREEQKAA